jgi:hypothetical protein
MKRSLLRMRQNMKTKILGLALIVLQWSVCAQAQEKDVKYYAVLIEGAKVGYATHSRTVTDGQVRTTDTMDVTISRLGTPLRIKSVEMCVETLKGEPVSFEAEHDMGIGTMKTVGTVGNDGTVTVRTSGTGAGQDSNFVWPKGAVMAEGLRLIKAEKGFKEGDEYNVKIFSPGAAAAIDSRVRVGGRQAVDLLGRMVTLTKVETVMSMPGTGEITTTCFVDEEFRALKSIMPMAGMKVELAACDKEFALGDNQVLDIVDKMFLASPESLKDVGSAKSITYYLKPVGEAGSFTIPASDNQRVERLEDGSVKVTVEPVSAPAGGTFPYKGTDEKILEATRLSRYLQSDDAKITGLAKQAAGDAKDAGEAARRVEHFVAGYVKNISLSVGYASASEVAASRKGDCTEFAVLCAAMCRAVGIPARVVVGVAYVENFAGRTGFGGHAWTEAYTGDKWVGLDAAFKAGGVGGFDAGHIALAAGDGEPADFFNLATTLGRFKIEKVVVNRGK